MYGVQKGALSVSTAPFNALAASNSQHTYQILVPSLNVFVDRKIVWESGVFLQSSVWPTLPCDPRDGAYSSSAPYVPTTSNNVTSPNFGGSASIDTCLQASPESDLFRRTLAANSFPSAGNAPSFPTVQGDYYEIAQPGTNFNLCPFPLQSLCNSMTCSINDCSVTTNGDTLQEQILLTNTRDTQRIRTTPSKFDQYAWTLDDYQSENGNMTQMNFQRPSVGEIPTGAWPVTFYNPVDGTRLIDDANNCGAYLDPQSKCPVYYINGRPIVIPGGILCGAQATVSMAVQYTTFTVNTATQIATVTYTSTSDFQAQCFIPGSMFTITGLVGSEAIWNGYYTVQTSSANTNTPPPAVNTQQILTFKYGSVATAGASGAVAFTSRGGQSISGTSTFTLTSDRLPSANSNLTYEPANCVSKLLGQVLPNGVQIMPSPMNVPMTVSMLYNVAEPIVMSPFIYQDALEFNNVGLYGCTNIQFTMNIQAPSPNCQSIQQGSWPTAIAPFSVVRTNCDYPAGGTILRTTGAIGAFSSVSLTAPTGLVSTTGAFQNPRMVVQFLTPGPDVSLPLISNVPYMEFPRYTNTYLVSDPKASTYSIQSQTITLSSIPDFIMVYAKARSRCQLQNETYVPIQRAAITFDNFSNLCSNMTQYELYTCSVAAGLDMDYQTWRGYANASGMRIANGSVMAGPSQTNGNAIPWGSFAGNLTVQISVTGGVYTYAFTSALAGVVPFTSTSPALTYTAPPQLVVLWGMGGVLATLNGVQVILSNNSLVGTTNQITFTSNVGPTNASAITGTAAPFVFSGGVLSVFNSPVNATGPLSAVFPVSQGQYSVGGSKVPYELSTGTSNLWPVVSGLFNVAGRNKIVPRSTTQLTGGPLMLRMGHDVSLSPGLAPGTLGNFSIQLNLTLDNSQHFFDAYSSYQLTIIAVNSGYFETVRGQSAVRKTILNMADVESASVASGVTTTQLRRLVGGSRGYGNSGLHPYVGTRRGGEGGAMHHKRRHVEGSGL